MSQATQPVSTSPAPTAPPPELADASSMLADAIDSLPELDTESSEPAKAAPTPAPEKRSATEQAKPEASEPKRKGAWKINEALFAEAALATADGVKAAGAHVVEGKRELHRKWLGMEEREQRFKRTKDETLQLQQNLRAQAGLLQNNLQALRVGDARTVLSALQQLTGQDPVRWLEQLNIHVARNGKQTEVAPEVAEVKSELAQLRQEREQERLQLQAAREDQFVQQRLGQMVALAQSNAEQWPEVSRYARDNPNGVARALHTIKTEHYQRFGSAMDDDAAIGNLEQQIGYFRSSPETENRASPQGVGAREPAVSQQTKPETGPQRSPGKSVTPSLASQVVTTREMTEEERLRDLAEDPEFLAMFGL